MEQRPCLHRAAGKHDLISYEMGSKNQCRHALVHPQQTDNDYEQKQDEGPVHDQPLFHCIEY